MGSSLSTSFAQIETGAASIDEGLGVLIQQLTGVGGAAEGVGSQLGSIGQAATASLAGVEQLSSSSKKAAESEIELAGVLDFLVHGLTIAGKAMEHLGIEAAGELAKGLEEIIGPLTTSSTLSPILESAINGVSTAISSVIPGLTSAGQALQGVASGLGEVSTAASAASGPISSLEGISATAPALTSVSEGMQAVGASLAGVEGQISGVTAGLDSLLASLMAVGEAGDVVTQAVSTTNAAIAEAAAPLADETGQLLMFSQAAADATGQLLLFETVAFETAAAEEAQAAAQAEASASLSQYNVILGEGVAQSATLAKAIAVLNQELAKGVVNQEAIAVASQAVATAAQKAGFSVVQTAAGMKILTASTKEAEEEFTHLDGLMAMVSARAGAVMAGVGQLGFGLGMLARTLPSIGTLFVYAFPVIAVGLMAEVIQTIIDKIRKADDEIRKTSVAFDDLAASAQASANSLELQNLKLEDQIAKLEGRPLTNHLKEALLEAAIEADRLAGALSKDIEKSIELMEKADVSFFKSLYTGQAPTSAVFGFGDELKKAKDSLGDYQLAIEKARSAQIDYEQSHSDAAKTARDVANAELENQKKITQGVIQETQKRLQERKAEKAADIAETYKAVGAAYPGGVRTTVPPSGMSKEEFFKIEAAKAATREFRQEAQALYETNSALKSFDLTAAAVIEHQKALESSAKAQSAVDKFSREKLLEDPGIKARQEAGVREAEVMRASSTSLLAQQEEQIKLEAVNAQIGGRVKEVAEEEAARRIEEVRADHTQRLLMAQDKEFEARKAALQEELDLSQKDPNQAKREASYTTLTARLQELEKDNQAKLADIAEKGGTELLSAELNAAKARLEARKKLDQDLINETRITTKAVVEASRSDSDDEIRSVRATAEQKLRLIQDEEQLGVLTHKQALTQRLAVLEEETIAANTAYQKQVEALRTQQNAIKAIIDANTQNRELTKSLTDIYFQLETEILKVSNSEEKLGDSINKVKVDDQINQWKQAKAVVADFTNSATGAFENFAESVFTRNQSIKQDFFQLTIALEREFIRMIANMITQTALFNAIRTHIQNAIGKVFGISPTAPGAAGTAAGAGTEVAGRTAEATALNTNVVSLGAFGSAVNAATVSLGGHIPVVTADTTAQAANATAVHGSTSAHGLHLTAVLHSTGAHIVHAFAVIRSTFSHILHAITVGLSTTAHALHTVIVGIVTGAYIAHAAAVIADTIALIIHKVVSLFTGATGGLVQLAQTGGLIQGPGTGTSDSIPMRVSHGEYIIKAASVSQPGMLELLHGLNSGAITPQKLVAAQGMNLRMQQLALGANVSNSTTQQSNSPFALNYHAGDTYALDGEGVGSVLSKHPAQLSRFIEGLVRSGRIKPQSLVGK